MLSAREVLTCILFYNCTTSPNSDYGLGNYLNDGQFLYYFLYYFLFKSRPYLHPHVEPNSLEEVNSSVMCLMIDIVHHR